MQDLMLPVNERDHSIGTKTAPVTLVEYGDYECPHCGRARFVVEQILEEQGNRIRFVFRNFPLTRIHPHAFEASLAAEAAANQHKFWEMHAALFDNQDAFSRELFMSLAEELGLREARFVEDMRSEAVEAKILQDIDSGFRSGVYGTPTFFINGHRHDDSYQYEVLSQAVEQALAVAARS